MSPRRAKRGQSLAFFALLLPALFAFCALGLDAGNLYIERREMQAAADLAALSGARLLPNAATAIVKAQAIATANGYASTVTVTTPYGGDPMRIEVSITHPIRTLFLPVLGVSQVDMSARSVARNTTATGNPYAIFAGANSCAGNSSDSVEWLGSDGAVMGQVHSNSGIKVSGGNNNWTGGTSYKCIGGLQESQGSNVRSPAATQVVADIAYPIGYTWADFCAAPTYYNATGTWDLSGNGPWWLGGTKASRVLLPGVYCADGAGATITLTSNSVTANNVTLVSRGAVRINDNSFLITARTLGTAVAAFGSGAQVAKVNARSGTTGIVYGPNGEVQFSGADGGIYSGAIIANTVKVSGRFTIVGTVPSGPSTILLQLFE